jgi:hypothetical protein
LADPSKVRRRGQSPTLRSLIAESNGNEQVVRRLRPVSIFKPNDSPGYFFRPWLERESKEVKINNIFSLFAVSSQQ